MAEKSRTYAVTITTPGGHPGLDAHDIRDVILDGLGFPDNVRIAVVEVGDIATTKRK